MGTNTYDGICSQCGEVVPAAKGVVNGKLGDGSWRVVGDCCIVVHSPMKDPDYWVQSFVRRMKILVEEIERLTPEELADLRATPQAELLREWLGSAPNQEFDL